MHIPLTPELHVNDCYNSENIVMIDIISVETCTG